MIDARTLVKDVALAGPRAAALLDEWRIDYCCHGDETIACACAAVGIDARAAIERLERAGSTEDPRRWVERGVSELVDFVVGTCHRDTREAFARVDGLLRALRADRDREALRGAFDRLAAHALDHMRREDERHYAHARELARARNGVGPWPVTRSALHLHAVEIRESHAHTHERARGLRDLAEATLADRPDALDALQAIRALYDRVTWQMHLENNVLLPRALDLEPS